MISTRKYSSFNLKKQTFFIILIENVLALFNVYFHFKNVLEQDYLIPGDHYGMVRMICLCSYNFSSKNLI
jgi:hypothetical protein